MPVHNADVAALFEAGANLLAIQGGNAFRIRAYRNAARPLNQLSRLWPILWRPRRTSATCRT
jgi:DNA polymerase (family 10)